MDESDKNHYFKCKYYVNDLEKPISSDSQLFQSFPTEAAQIDSEQPISSDSQLFQSFPTETAQIDLEWPILPNSQLFQSFPSEAAQIDLNGVYIYIYIYEFLLCLINHIVWTVSMYWPSLGSYLPAPLEVPSDLRPTQASIRSTPKGV